MRFFKISENTIINLEQITYITKEDEMIFLYTSDGEDYSLHQDEDKKIIRKLNKIISMFEDNNV